MTCSSTVYDVYNPSGDVCSLSSVDNEELLKENSAVGKSLALILYYCVFITFHCRRCVRKFINNSPVVKGDFDHCIFQHQWFCVQCSLLS